MNLEDQMMQLHDRVVELEVGNAELRALVGELAERQKKLFALRIEVDGGIVPLYDLLQGDPDGSTAPAE